MNGICNEVLYLSLVFFVNSVQEIQHRGIVEIKE